MERINRNYKKITLKPTNNGGNQMELNGEKLSLDDAILRYEEPEIQEVIWKQIDKKAKSTVILLAKVSGIPRKTIVFNYLIQLKSQEV